MRQPSGTGKLIEIDLIDADPSAFDRTGDVPARERRPLPRRLLITVFATVATVLALGTTMLVWQPRQHERAPAGLADVSPQAVTIGMGAAPDGTPWRATIALGDPVVVCIQDGSGAMAASCTFGSAIVPATFVVNFADAVFVIAAVSADAGSVLRIVDAEGVVFSYAPAPVDDTTSAVAARLPPGATYELLTK